MDLTTSYMGLSLKNPFIAGASPQSDDLGVVAQLEAAGASALVMHSLFEEQLYPPPKADELYNDATTYFPNEKIFSLTPDSYATHLVRLKQQVKIPIIASLNGTSSAGWVRYAQFLEAFGADALELNIYGISTDPSVTCAEMERRTLNVVTAVRSVIRIPLAVKILPFYSSLPHFTRRLVDEGADAIVLFNRSYYPAIDVEELTVTPMPDLSGSWELPLRLRWLGMLYGKVNASFCVTGGVHTVEDAVKALLAGADSVQMVSALLMHGPNYLKEVIDGVQRWMHTRRFEKLDAFRGLLSLKNCPDAAGYDRASYAQTLQLWNKKKPPLNP